MVVRGCFVIRDSVDTQNEDIFNLLHSDTLISQQFVMFDYNSISENI